MEAVVEDHCGCGRGRSGGSIWQKESVQDV
jgi:hypothetical protein